MNESKAKRIVSVCKQCFREQDLYILWELPEVGRITFLATGTHDAIFLNMSCTYDPSHELVELSMVSSDTFPEQAMASLLELVDLLNIAEITATWSVTPDRNVELRGALMCNPDTLDKAQVKKTLARFMECVSRCYPAIVNHVSGGKTAQESMDKLVEQNKDFFI